MRLKNQDAFKDYFAKEAKKIEAALLFNLEYLIEDAINHAKSNAGYKDQTSNLKSSIGGAVIKNNKVVNYKGFVKEGNADTGNATGLDFLNSLVKQASAGYVILLVAGMDYASYVENFHGLNVLKKTELYIGLELPALIKDIKSNFN